MKKTLIHFLTLFLILDFVCMSNYVHSQIFPRVDSIKIIPSNPSQSDSIYVVTDVTIPHIGRFIGYEILDSGSLIHIQGCYFSGFLAEEQKHIDTINLGLKTDGNYQVIFNAYLSSSPITCVPIDSNDTSINFSVGLVGIKEIVVPKKELIKVLDMTGRRSKEVHNKLLIYIYNDGTAEKVFIAE
jgi:hypothetical protein